MSVEDDVVAAIFTIWLCLWLGLVFWIITGRDPWPPFRSHR